MISCLVVHDAVKVVMIQGRVPPAVTEPENVELNNRSHRHDEVA